jgi:hypothetical protein
VGCTSWSRADILCTKGKTYPKQYCFSVKLKAPAKISFKNIKNILFVVDGWDSRLYFFFFSRHTIHLCTQFCISWNLVNLLPEIFATFWNHKNRRSLYIVEILTVCLFYSVYSFYLARKTTAFQIHSEHSYFFKVNMNRKGYAKHMPLEESSSTSI